MIMFDFKGLRLIWMFYVFLRLTNRFRNISKKDYI
jgi:hypothetical protein